MIRRPWELYEEKGSGEEPPPGGAGKGGDSDGKGKDNGNDKGKGSGDKTDDKEIEAALSLYRALQDEDIGTDVIKTLARKAGILKDGDDEGGDKPDVKKVEKRVTKILKKHLGKDYDKFSDLVGPAFEEAMEEYVNSKLGAERAKVTKKTWQSAVDQFTEAYEVPAKVERLMQEIMEDTPPNFESARFNPQKYLRRVYKEALEELGEEEKPKKRTNKSKEDDEPSDFVDREAPSNYTIDDAVEAAMKGIRFKHKG